MPLFGKSSDEIPPKPIDPSNLFSDRVSALTQEHLSELLGLPKLSQAKFPLYLNFEHSLFQLQDLSCFDEPFPAHVVKDLNLSNNALLEFSTNGGFKKLRRLVLNDNDIVLCSLRGLSSLTFLSLANCQLQRLPDLSSCKKLQHVNFSGNCIESGFGQLAQLSALQHVDLSKNDIDLNLQQVYHFLMRPLRDLEELESLDLSDNPVLHCVDDNFLFFVLSEMPDLEFFNGAAIRKAERKKAAKLDRAYWGKKFVRTWRSPIALEPLVHQRGRRELERYKRAISDMLPVYQREKTVITTLTKRMLEEFFLTPLNELQYPVFLDLSYSFFKLDSIDINKFIGDVLEELNLNNNALVSLGQLPRFSNLRRLCLDDNKLRAFSFAGFTFLEELSLRNNDLRVIPSPSEAPRLQVLDLSGNCIRVGFEELGNIRLLRRLDLSANDLRLSLQQFYHFVLLPLHRCRHLEFVNFDQNPMAMDDDGGIPHFVYFLISELPTLQWYHNMFVMNEDHVQAHQRGTKHRLWKDKTHKPEPLPDVPSAGTASRSKKKNKTLKFSVPRAMNLLAQIQADDHNLKPIPNLHRLIDEFLEHDPQLRAFEHEESQTPEESLAALLKTAQDTFKMNEHHRREILSMVVKLSGIRNESLCDYSVQIINVLLLLLEDPQERADMIQVAKKTFGRLLLPQFSPDVHLTMVRNMQRLVPYHSELSDECCDDPLIIQSLVNAFSIPDSDLEIAWDLLVQFVRKVLQRKYDFDSDRREVLEQFRLGHLLTYSLVERKVKSFPESVFKPMAECISAAFALFPSLAEDALPACDRLVRACQKILTKLGYGDKPADVNANQVELLEQARCWILIATALLHFPATARQLAKESYPEVLVPVLEACEKRNVPRFPLFQVITRSIACLLRHSPKVTAHLRVQYPGLPAVLMRVVRKSSEAHKYLIFRWQKQHCREDFTKDNHHFDDAAEIILHLTKNTPIDNPGPSTRKRNIVLEEVVSERPNSFVARLIMETLGLEPRKGFKHWLMGSSKW